MKELVTIQSKLKAPKNLYNSFGKYNYRNFESICEAVKPLLAETGCSLIATDDVIQVGERYYIKATLTLTNASGESVSVSAMAREALDKKGMDDSQITGTASSYARKYAANGLFLLDDTKDADTDEYHKETEAKAKRSKPAPKQEAEPQGMSDDAVRYTMNILADYEIAPTYVCELYRVDEIRNLNKKQVDHLHSNLIKIKDMYEQFKAKEQ